jgi:beta-aspartyl-peptidase (threonine type)
MKIRAFRAALPLLAAAGFAACAATAQPAAVQPSAAPAAPTDGAPRWGLVIHGGAGPIERGSMTPEREAEYRAKLTEALQAGHAVLAQGGASLDAVVAAVRVMEDSPLFNAGKGAVFTHEGKNELDAAIMDGPTRMAGTIAGVRHVKNPITLARLVMEKSPHVMMIGEGAEAFGRQHGVEMVPESYFHTESRWRALERAKQQERIELSEDSAAVRTSWIEQEDFKFGTVGAVALDQQGRLAAGTSTGGMTNKRWGRVGDVPIIGGGTYANADCAVSATGHGEYFIRAVVAYDICAIHQYRGASVRDAADEVVMQKLVEMGGEGGVITMDGQGNVSMPFNSSGMYRGRIDAAGNVTVAIYRD